MSKDNNNIYGEGTFSVVRKRPNTPIRYRKRINGRYINVYGKNERDCRKKMKLKEAAILEQEKYMHPSDISNCSLLRDSIKYWLDTYKKTSLTIYFSNTLMLQKYHKSAAILLNRKSRKS